MNKFIPQLDWRAYFQRFSELHGGNPLQWKGWLLFPDGWRYSATSHRGPEAAPQDDDECKKIQTIYWKMRLASVSKEQRELRAALVGLEQHERVFSAPLQQRITREVPGKNEFGDPITRRVPDAVDLDLEGLRSRIAWLLDDIALCERILSELSNTKEQKDVEAQSEGEESRVRVRSARDEGDQGVSQDGATDGRTESRH